MKGRPQSRARICHRDCEILVERIGLRNMSFSIRCSSGLELDGFTDERVTVRRFARQLTARLDDELRKIEDFAEKTQRPDRLRANTKVG
jgi:hypothetical protein